jgi:hypothetical protein
MKLQITVNNGSGETEDILEIVTMKEVKKVLKS